MYDADFVSIESTDRAACLHVSLHPAVSHNWAVVGLPELAAMQLELLRAGIRMLRHGARLVYSTCSLESEENGGVVDEFLAEHPDFKLERARELLPFVDGVDGTYVARMSRNPSQGNREMV